MTMGCTMVAGSVLANLQLMLTPAGARRQGCCSEIPAILPWIRKEGTASDMKMQNVSNGTMKTTESEDSRNWWCQMQHAALLSKLHVGTQIGSILLQKIGISAWHIMRIMAGPSRASWHMTPSKLKPSGQVGLKLRLHSQAGFWPWELPASTGMVWHCVCLRLFSIYLKSCSRLVSCRGSWDVSLNHCE